MDRDLAARRPSRARPPGPQRLIPQIGGFAGPLYKPIIATHLATDPALSAVRLFAECRAAGASILSSTGDGGDFQMSTGGEFEMSTDIHQIGAGSNRVAPEVEAAILALALAEPAWGQLRVANDLAKRGVRISPAGVRCVWAGHDLKTMAHR